MAEMIPCPKCGKVWFLNGKPWYGLSGALMSDGTVSIVAGKIDWFCTECGTLVTVTDHKGCKD